MGFHSVLEGQRPMNVFSHMGDGHHRFPQLWGTRQIPAEWNQDRAEWKLFDVELGTVLPMSQSLFQLGWLKTCLSDKRLEASVLALLALYIHGYPISDLAAETVFIQ